MFSSIHCWARNLHVNEAKQKHIMTICKPKILFKMQQGLFKRCKRKLEIGRTGKEAGIYGLSDTQKQILQRAEK